MKHQWSPQQAQAIDLAGAWLKRCDREVKAGRRLSQPILRIFGYAGTGKTTIAKHLADGVQSPVFAAFTGKAALMMQRNGCVGASTIHGLIYQVIETASGAVRFVLDKESAASTSGLIVIDECSMVDEEIGSDILSFDRPVLVLGDPAQLPPVRGAGFFTEATPDILLTEIHRQARDNPIIDMATTVREGGKLRAGTFGSSRVVQRGVLRGSEVIAADQVLVGKNATRSTYNARMRALRGFTDDMPEVGDRLVCLRNDKTLGIFNGGMFCVEGHVSKMTDHLHIGLELSSEDFPRRPPIMVKVRREFFNGTPNDIPWQELRGTQQFDFGYALTVHKAQGSQWGDVILYDESGIFREDARRFLYTGITRASETVTVVI